MAYVLIQGYMCERCGYRWGSRTGTGMRPRTDPRTCPKCKTPYWNKPRTKRIQPGRKAMAWDVVGKDQKEKSTGPGSAEQEQEGA